MPALDPIPATVISVHDIASNMRRLVLSGEGLEALLPPPGTLAPYLKLHLQDASGCPCIRTYSLRHIDLARAELHVDIALHGDDSVGSRFALRSRRGDRIGLRGPGIIPAPLCKSYLLAGDHTALSAIAYTLDQLPADADVHVVIETASSDAECLLACTGRRRLTCLRRRNGAPSELAEAVRVLVPTPQEGLFVWAGAEAGITRAIRRHARNQLALQPDRYQILNYWKAGRAEGDFDCMV